VRDRIIVALDTPDGEEAARIAERLKGSVGHLKVGLTLFLSEGPAVVGRLRGMGFDVFVDLKLHDIPHQVAGAARALTMLGASMFTVHAGGGEAMVRAAVEAVAETAEQRGVPAPEVIAVTVLTSMDDHALAATGVPDPASAQVRRLARLAASQGADGIVCSPAEVAEARALLGPAAVLVTPGVRPSWAEAGDQARIATPRAALDAGASWLIIGRPVTDAADPAEAVERIVSDAPRS
jgi:orotidine-5'-phosphate decarboxylase